MIPCKHCNTFNSLDSTFCKHCGTTLGEDELAEARAQLEKVVEEGFSALSHERVEEASAIAESAVVTDPSSTRALSLKASCHERRGEIAEALECAERIVELNPNSELDKIKRNQLRSALASSTRSSAPPGRLVAALAAVSAVVLVICIGVIVARRPEKTPDPNLVAKNDPAVTLASRPDAFAQQAPNYGQAPPQAQPQQQQSPPAISEDPTDGYVARPTEAPSNRRRYNSNSLPPATGDPAAPQLDIKPVEPTLPPIGSSPKEDKVQNNGGGDPAPAPAPQDNNNVAQPPQDQGYIEIRPHGDQSSRVKGSGSDHVASPANSDSPRLYVNIGQQAYQIGNLSSAAANFEKALKLGGDPISLNKLLGQTYAGQGDTGRAVSAYQRAIDASNAALASGKGNGVRIQAVKDACQAALNQLHG